MAVRDSQVAVEVLQTDSDPTVRNTQVAIEALLTDGDPVMRNTQVAVEVMLAAYGYARFHQVAVEVLSKSDQGNAPLALIIT